MKDPYIISTLHSQVKLEHLLVHVRANWEWISVFNNHLCRQMVKLRYTIFICYATRADEGQTQCNTYSGTSHNGQPLYNGHWLWHQMKLLQN